MAIRRQWLIDQQLADGNGDGIALRAGTLEILQRRELLRVVDQLSSELDKPFVESRAGTAVEGHLARKLDLVSGRFALLENGRHFTLVPWRPVLEKQIGKQVGGIMRAEGISWRLGWQRGGPEIS